MHLHCAHHGGAHHVPPDDAAGPRCRFCRSTRGRILLDLGSQPACDHFPLVTDPLPDPTYPLRLWLCDGCELAQLAEDATVPEEPRAVQPAALAAQAAAAVELVAAAGLLAGRDTVAEFGSPHGDTWLPLFAARGLRAGSPDVVADVVVDCFGLMHAADQAAALAERVARLAPDGVLLVQYHSLATIVDLGQFNAVRHGHYAYYSTAALVNMLRRAGLGAFAAWRFDLYGGTVLLAARRGGQPDTSVRTLLDAERPRLVGVGSLQQAAARGPAELAGRLRAARAAGRRVLGYGAASRAVALLTLAGVDCALLPAVADAAPAKHGRRLPGSGIPIITPAELVAARPDEVLLFLPDLLPEVRAALPEIKRWTVVG